MAKQRLIKSQPLRKKVAVVCGGSKGIGKETAKEILRLGGSVCVIARAEEALELAAGEMEALIRSEHQFVKAIPCDATDMVRLQPVLSDFVNRHGVPDYLLNVIGYAYPQYIQKLSLSDCRDAMEVNYYGQLVPILILLPHFMDSRKGHIANVSSVMGFTGIMGYATYAPTKFAIVGLTEVLRNELKPYGIKLSILFPPDTDTPGFEIENKSKPEETAMMSENVKMMSAEAVGEAFVEGLLKERYFILPGETALVWRVNRFFPWLIRWISDRDLKSARKRLGKI
jgi:3-dehydrosphinganine reductase